MAVNKNKSIVSIIVIIGACLAVTWLFIVPNIQAIVKINRDISSQREDLESKAALGLNIKKTSQDLADISERIKLLDTMYVKPGSELEFLGILDRLAQESQINAQVMPRFSDKAPTKLSKVPLEITAIGPYDRLIGYWRTLESMPYYYNVDSAELQGSDAAALTLKLSGNIYLNP